MLLLAAPVARAADPAAQLVTFTASPAGVEALQAAVDKLMASEVGKEFPGRLWLQVRLADGAARCSPWVVATSRRARYACCLTSRPLSSKGNEEP